MTIDKRQIRAESAHARCTIKTERNKGANYWKMTRDRAESVTCI